MKWTARTRQPLRQPSPASPARERARLHPIVVTVLVAGVLLSALVSLALARQGAESRALGFRADAEVVAAQLQETFTFAVHDLDAERSLLAVTDNVSREQFDAFLRHHHRNVAAPGLKGLAWVPRVPAEQLAAFEAEARAEGLPRFQVWEMGPGMKPHPVSARSEYFPVAFLSPIATNSRMLGMDLASSTLAGPVLTAARATGIPQVATGNMLGTGAHDTVLLVEPIYGVDPAFDALGERRAELSGYLVGLYSLAELVQRPLADSLAAGDQVYLFAGLEPASPAVYQAVGGALAATPGSTPGSTPATLGRAPGAPAADPPAPTLAAIAATLRAGPSFRAELDVDGIPWLLLMGPAAGSGAGWLQTLPWLALLLGLLVTTISATYLHRRQQAERRLSSERALLRTLLDAIPELVSYHDTAGVLRACNQAFAQAHAAEIRQLVGKPAPDLGGEPVAEQDALPPAAQGELQPSRQWVVQPSGARILYDTEAAPAYDRRGKVVGVLEVSRNLTATWRAAALLRARLALSDFATGHSLEELLRCAIDRAEELTGSTCGFFHFLVEEPQAFLLEAWSTNTLAKLCSLVPQDRHYPVSKAGLWAECVRTRQPVVCNDYPALDRTGQFLPPDHAPITRFVAVPILRGEHMVAVLGVGNKAAPYEEADVALLVQFADAAWDIILRKRAEDAVAVSLEKYRVLFESFPLGISITDQHLAVVEANPASERLLGISRAEHTQRTVDGPQWRAIRLDGSPMPPDEFPAVRAMREHKLVHDLRMGIVKPDQGVTWLAVTAAPMLVENYGLAIAYSDVTEQWQSERLTAAQNAVSRILASSLPFAAAVPQLLEAMARPLGWDAGELWWVGAEPTQVAWCSSWVQPGRPELVAFAASGQDHNAASRVPNPSQEWAFNLPAWVEELADTTLCVRQTAACAAGLRAAVRVPIKAGDRIVGVLAFFSAATLHRDERMVETLLDLGRQLGLFAARQQAEADLRAERALLAQHVEERTAELRIANARLAHALRTKDEFLASMSHELRTPLHGILTLAETLQLQTIGPLNPRQERSVHLIEQSGQHLLSLINDVLDLAKVEAGKLTLDHDWIEVDAVCQASLHLVREVAAKKGVQLGYELAVPRFGMFADGRRLKQILVNLLSNGVKFTPAEGSVCLHVDLATDSNEVTFTVSDTGIGIAPDQLGLLFQPFTQLDGGLARSHEGTGLGLALVRQLVELHGGQVCAESDGIPGHGSRFSVTLPYQRPAQAIEAGRVAAGPTEGETTEGELTAAAPAGNTSEPAAAASPLLTGITILVADDNDLNRQAVSDYLTTCGCSVLLAANGRQALDLTAAHAPNLILMDIQMPVIDGLEATRQLRSAAGTCAIPVIALTALATEADRTRCLAAGADDYLAKPVSMRTLAVHIETVMALRRAASV